MAQYHILHMRPFDPKSGYLNVIIETPKGSRTKFKYDEKHGLFMFDRNDRFITVPIEAKSQKPPAQSIDSLDPVLAENITKFFMVYNGLQGKEFKPLRCAGPDRAMELIREGFTKVSLSKKKARGATA